VTNNTARDLVNEVTETLVREARDREAAALQKALETAEENEAPATSLVSADVAADAEQVVNVAGELKQIATSEAANLLTPSDGNKTSQNQSAEDSELSVSDQSSSSFDIQILE
jgi:hypothetical protein